MNRLALEESPYLRQHAHNPVDWYPWGPDALARARTENRPILLSIGYSACHWCHVMERESFDDPLIAQIMNEGFVNVKVDREERPDIDSLYMRAVQALSGQGGWPLTVFLTPDGEPFYGGTYFPPNPKHGLPSFRQLLEATLSAWSERPDEVRVAGSRLTDLLRRSVAPQSPESGETPQGDAESPWSERVRQGAEEILSRADPAFGGFGRSPKFPQPVVLEFLLEHHVRTDDPEALEAVVLTLRRMAAGGIRDQLAGGFHRYAVDQRWLVPHFEKMLYDNALLAGVYLRAWQVTGDGAFSLVCREILEDLLRDFLSPEGGFHTAWDADSEGEEGRFYVWTEEEIEGLLPAEEARLFCRVHGVSEGGNFEGRNILHVPDGHLRHGLDEIAHSEGITRESLDGRISDSRRILLQARALREPPLRDEKILAGWNALAIRAMAEAGATLAEPRYVEAATRCATWLLVVLRPEGRLLHQRPGRGPMISAFLEDVAGMGNALLSLHEATLDPRWLLEAIALDAEVEARFRDRDTGLLHDTPDDGEKLILRPRETSDSPIPSGHSLAVELRLRLGRLLGDDDRIRQAERLIQAEEASIKGVPIGFGRLLAVAGRLEMPPVEIVITGAGDDSETWSLLHAAHRTYLPGRVVSGIRRGEPAPLDSPLFAGKDGFEGKDGLGESPTAFVCRAFACSAPTRDADEVARTLASAAGN